MMVVLLIIIIVSTVGVPAWNQFINKYRAQSYMKELSQQLAYARVMASGQASIVRLCSYQYGECQSDWAASPIQVSVWQDAEWHLIRQLPAVHSSHQLHYSRTQLSFRRDGSLGPLENGSFLYCPHQGLNWHYRLTLNQAGRSRLHYQHSACPV